MAEVDVQALIERTLAGDEAAWQALWREVEPALYAMLRRPRVLGRLASSEDDCRNIVVEVMARLRADGFARLARYAQARRERPTLPFLGWLTVVARRVAVDYMRCHEAYVDRRHVRDATSPGAWREIGALPSDSQLSGGRPPVTNRGTAHEVYAYARAELPDDQRAALGAWLEGATFEEIAGDELAGDEIAGDELAGNEIARGAPRDAARRVRAALGSLRRRFRGGR